MIEGHTYSAINIYDYNHSKCTAYVVDYSPSCWHWNEHEIKCCISHVQDVLSISVVLYEKKHKQVNAVISVIILQSTYLIGAGVMINTIIFSWMQSNMKNATEIESNIGNTWFYARLYLIKYTIKSYTSKHSLQTETTFA